MKISLPLQCRFLLVLPASLVAGRGPTPFLANSAENSRREHSKLEQARLSIEIEARLSHVGYVPERDDEIRTIIGVMGPGKHSDTPDEREFRILPLSEALSLIEDISSEF